MREQVAIDAGPVVGVDDGAASVAVRSGQRGGRRASQLPGGLRAEGRGESGRGLRAGSARGRGAGDPSGVRQVAVLVETSTTWGQSIVRGVGDYAREHGGMSLFFEPRGRLERLELPGGWRFDGVIARVTHQALADQIAEFSLPAVNVSWWQYERPTIARVTADIDRIAQLAFDHLKERGLRHFAYLPPHDRPGYDDRLGQSYRRLLREGGLELREPPIDGPGAESFRPEQPWDTRLDAIGAWALTLPLPCGVLTFGDTYGRHLTEACRRVGLRIPEDIAILSSEQDELSSQVSVPQLSSVDVAGDRIGYASAELLDRMMRGAAAPTTAVLIRPRGIVSRQTTEMLAFEDDDLASVLQFIRENAFRPIGVEDLLDQTQVSRRKLERRFKEVLGRSPAAVIRKVRLEQAKRLLYDTDGGVHEIARASGFTGPEAMVRAFRTEFGVTPTEFRRAGG